MKITDLRWMVKWGEGGERRGERWEVTNEPSNENKEFVSWGLTFYHQLCHSIGGMQPYISPYSQTHRSLGRKAFRADRILNK